MTVRHFTAWLVSDTSALDQPNMDITVLEDTLVGENPEDDGAWSTDGSKPAAFYGITETDARDGDADEGIRQAERLLADAGWSTVGKWEAVDTGCIITVERDED
jgi:hypothetical protein